MADNIKFSKDLEEMCQKEKIRFIDTSFNRMEVLTNLVEYIKNTVS